jgi:2-iminobutanoate/2-iminopropanoate deaminase
VTPTSSAWRWRRRTRTRRPWCSSCACAVASTWRAGELVQGSIADQTRRALQNIGEILTAGGGSFPQVVRTTVYLADLGDFTAMNEVYATFFTAPQPARSTIQAARLPRDARIEIDVIAFLG